MNKHYACSDLHGMWDLWEQISEYCDDTDTIYFLGDAADRGKYGIKIMESMFKDKRVKYLFGNHEEMFLRVAPQIQGMDIDELDYFIGQINDFNWWIENGGRFTMLDFIRRPRREQNWLIDKVKEIENYCIDIYKNKYDENVILCHAGTALDYTDKELLSFGKQNYLLWDRKHYFKPWPEGYDNFYIVHGHTPVMNMCKETKISLYGHYNNKRKLAPSIINYSNGHKFNLDLGSFSTGTVALFDLDELKVEQYFDTEVEVK